MSLQNTYRVDNLIINTNVIDDSIVTGVFIGFDHDNMHEIKFDDPFQAALFVNQIDVYYRNPSPKEVSLENRVKFLEDVTFGKRETIGWTFTQYDRDGNVLYSFDIRDGLTCAQEKVV